MPWDGLAKRKPAATLGSLWRDHVVSCKGCQQQWKELGNILPSWVLQWLQPCQEFTTPQKLNLGPPAKPFLNPRFTKTGRQWSICCFKCQGLGTICVPRQATDLEMQPPKSKTGLNFVHFAVNIYTYTCQVWGLINCAGNILSTHR